LLKPGISEYDVFSVISVLKIGNEGVEEMQTLRLIVQVGAAAEDPTTTTAGGAGSVVPPTFSAWAVAYGVGALFLLALLVLIIAWVRTWGWNDEKQMRELRGLGLPNGTVRSVLALLVVGGFILFAFTGRGIVGDNDQFTAILAAWVTLTGAVTGFYFGARTGQTLDPPPVKAHIRESVDVALVDSRVDDDTAG
jgi:hypothetical protein